MTHPSEKFPNLGFGLGLRPKHYDHIFNHSVAASGPLVDWFEIISENYMDTDGRPRRMLEKILADYPVVMHGVSLSIGTVDPLRQDYLKKLKALADWVQPAWVSDHLCWTGVAHKNTHDLLPVPYTEQALAHIVARIKTVQDVLGRPLVLENPSTYLEFSASSMPEWEFIARMAEQSGCGLLLDVNNIYVSCFNHKWDPKTYIDALPLRHVAQIHLAGHSHQGTHIVDTHDGPVIDDVWRLYKYVLNKKGPTSTMVEWDDKIPDFPVVAAELAKARQWAAAPEDIFELPAFEKPAHKIIRQDNRPHPAYKDLLDGLQQAILAGAADKLPAAVQVPDKRDFPAGAQLGVYINGYRYRLFDMMYDDFPALRRYLGREEFAKLVDAYIEATPSLHFNIARYAETFPAFVAQQSHDLAVHELAQLEFDILGVADMTETPVLSPRDLAEMTEDMLESVVFHPRKALVLRAFARDVNSYYSGVMQDNVDPLQAKPCFVAVYRHEDEVMRLPLTEEEYMLLSGLFGGLNVAAALAATMADDENAAEKLMEWFSRWINHGLLSRAEQAA